MFFRGLHIKTKLVLIFLLLVVLPLSFALEQTGTNYNSETLIVLGGDNSSSTNYETLVSIPIIVGKSGSTNYNSAIGAIYALTGYPPSVSGVTLMSTSGSNFTTDNLTVTYTTDDADANIVYAITDWKLDGKSVAILNMPFNKRVVDVSLPVEDYSDYNNDGTLGNGIEANKPTWVADCMVGGCYNFDGSNDVIEVTNADISSDLTISLWMKSSDYLTSIPISINGDSYTHGPDLFFDASGFINWNTGDGSVNRFTGSTTLDSSWHNVAIVNDFTSNTAKLYVDGVLNGTAVYRDSTVTNDIIHIGDLNSVGGYTFNGLIDEVLILNRSLSAEQVNQIYQDGLSGKSVETIVSQETDFGDIWRTEVIPVDEFDRGSGVLSNNIIIGSGDLKLVLNNTFINSTIAHTFTITAGASYSMGFGFIENVTINYDAFSCVASSNVTSGIYLNATFICTGTPYQSTNVNVTFCDFQDTCLTTPITGNDYPNQAPTLGTLISPNSSGYYTNRNESFNWTAGSDIEGDNLNYTINITNSFVVDPTPLPVANITTVYYYAENEMHTNDECWNGTATVPYIWNLQVCDLWDCSDWSTTENFTITSFLSVSITQNETNFNELAIGSTVDTDSVSTPFIFENDGNVNANATNVTATSLWSSVGLDTPFYQIKTDSSEAGSFDEAESQITWTNVLGTSNNNLLFGMLNYSNTNDELEVDFRVVVPGAEPPGDKTSIVNFWYVQS